MTPTDYSALRRDLLAVRRSEPTPRARLLAAAAACTPPDEVSDDAAALLLALSRAASGSVAEVRRRLVRAGFRLLPIGGLG